MLPELKGLGMIRTFPHSLPAPQEVLEVSGKEMKLIRERMKVTVQSWANGIVRTLVKTRSDLEFVIIKQSKGRMAGSVRGICDLISAL